MFNIKKKLIVAISALICLLISLTIIYVWPKDYASTLPGVLYQLGEDNADYSVQTTIVVEGTLTRSLTGEKTFRGKLEVVDDSMYDDSDTVKLIEVKFDRNQNNSALLYYEYVDNFLKTSVYGTIYINDDFSKIAIARQVQNENNPNSGSWSGNDGFMFAAPATTRDEAITISKEVMKIGGVNW